MRPRFRHGRTRTGRRRADQRRRHRGGAHVTIRAVQLAFRKHLDTTPMGYLRKVRLAGAHEQLLAASPDDGHTVTGVAAAWGFAHPGRFASSYRQAYGVAPQTTLHD
ncbi:helix-turn-helix transcriptional regulator [Nocardia amikacinitolerans]|uniref:helix-turn-helix transcriptional regulator n=1 Tax=Nocardia amikacinitolerans TaxID=756689 RepID=UPI0008328A99|nr:helix-turn-helix transcriptional regulator [Nocardia amikacinitolerans]